MFNTEVIRHQHAVACLRCERLSPTGVRSSLEVEVDRYRVVPSTIRRSILAKGA
jgi:hypothetical protein